MQNTPQTCRAFTLVELLTVICIILVMAGITVPAVNSLTNSNQLTSGADMILNSMSVARSEAISRNALTRFAVATSWANQPTFNYRKFSVWEYNTSGTWQQISNWQELPQDVVFDPNYSPAYDPGNVSGVNNYMFTSNALNTFSTNVAGNSVSMCYIEFTPAGAARTQNSTLSPEIWAGLTQGYISGSTVMKTGRIRSGSVANWAKVSANVLTGRLRITRP